MRSVLEDPPERNTAHARSTNSFSGRAVLQLRRPALTGPVVRRRLVNACHSQQVCGAASQHRRGPVSRPTQNTNRSCQLDDSPRAVGITVPNAVVDLLARGVEARRRVDVRPCRLIEQVIELRTELHCARAAESEALRHRQIPILRTRAVEMRVRMSAFVASPRRAREHEVLNHVSRDRSPRGSSGLHPGTTTDPPSPPPVKSKLSVVEKPTVWGVPVWNQRRSRPASYPGRLAAVGAPSRQTECRTRH